MKGLIPLFVLGIVLSAKGQESGAKTCPKVSEDPPTDVLLAHESDCSKFYKCSYGEKVLQSCPSGLHFNAEKDQCDWTDNVNCQNNNGEGEVEDNDSQSSGNEAHNNTCPLVEEDPEKDILFPHESDCAKFYKCSHGEKVLQSCPIGLHFNAEKDQCDWSDNVNCQNNNGEGEVEGNDSQSSGNEAHKNTCPSVEEDPEKDILFPHESDCAKFYKCSHGEKVLQSCPSGLHFNAEKDQCDWPDNVKCQNNNGEGEVEGNDSQSSGNEAHNNTCPSVEEDPEKDILFPHESDCAKFYKCSHGEKVLQSCPNGLHFDAEKDQCDWPDNVNCQNNNGEGEVEGNDSQSSGNEAHNNTCPSVEEDPEKDILFPHESDCAKFYKCSHGEKVLQSCPNGLHFNAEKDQCDWPDNVNCQNNNGEGEVEDNDSQSSGNEAHNNTCPSVEEDPEKDILFPHESDCAKFYKCSHGEKVLQSCPNGLHFNAEKDQCDWPDNVNCQNNNGEGEVEDNDSQSSGNEAHNNTCPSVEEDPEKDILFPHESDCAKFYKCSHGEKVLQSCPSGLHFNAEKDQCDWSDNVNCQNNNGEGEVEDNDSQSSGNEAHNNTCPSVEEDPEKDILFPHESDCAKFYKCSHGEKVLQSCPNGLHFNAEKDQCDWPDNENCQNNNGEGEIEDNDSQSSGNEAHNNTCPSVEEDPEKDILFPHESDCAKFYKCSHGEKVLQSCPSGLHFNAEKDQCDWPDNVNCQNNSSEDEDDSESDEDQDNTCPSVVEDPEEDILFPHESDCTKFYKCSHGEKTLQDCPGGLYYNPERRYCDWPQNTNCANNSTLTPVKNQQYLLPHESDCSKFYLVFNDIPFEYNCPSGLHFNRDLEVCDYKSNVKCPNQTDVEISKNVNNGIPN